MNDDIERFEIDAETYDRLVAELEAEGIELVSVEDWPAYREQMNEALDATGSHDIFAGCAKCNPALIYLHSILAHTCGLPNE